ncbi:hypothetical protein Dred_0568 [Desulforamulus reducens MI-1]|uniref:Uncharacterized protein n=1 Tax=Desulforamulus reducens (strain ATCC BAA-1160 / DSM 100696 / MI-1) TaxID=349161 RepID=A4J207_DESRM|nr:hypothetical protein Dred_0568 [Desulforamulus reducens MI-1]
MVHFRKRFDAETLKAINEEICNAARVAEDKKGDDDNRPEPPSGGNKAGVGEFTNPERKASSFETYHKSQGKLILDATCAPADIRILLTSPCLTKPGRSWMTL